MAVLSIIVPVFNAVEHLRDTVDSIISQSYDDFEVILVDDGSTDGSPELCRQLANEFNNIRVVAQQNSGPGVARNNGIMHSTGKYIAFVDSDDMIEPDMFKKLVALAEASNSDVVICGFIREYYVDGRLKRKQNYAFKACEFCGKGSFSDSFNEMNLSGIINPPWNKLFSADFLKNNGIFFPTDIFNGEDFLFNVDCLNKAEKISVTDDVLYHYIDACASSLTHKQDKSFFDTKLALYSRSLEKFDALNDEQKYSTVHDVFLRDCFQCVDRFSSDRAFLKKLLQNEFVFRAVSMSNADGGLFKLYKYALKSRSVFVLKTVSALRKTAKKIFNGML